MVQGSDRDPPQPSAHRTYSACTEGVSQRPARCCTLTPVPSHRTEVGTVGGTTGSVATPEPTNTVNVVAGSRVGYLDRLPGSNQGDPCRRQHPRIPAHTGVAQCGPSEATERTSKWEGRPSRNPWAWATPRERRVLRSASVSTPSTIIKVPVRWANQTMASHKAWRPE